MRKLGTSRLTPGLVRLHTTHSHATSHPPRPKSLRRLIETPVIRRNSVFKMRFSASTVLVTMLGWIGASAAHNIQLKAHSRECFHEMLHKDDLMTVSFQVGDREFGGSGNLEIDFWVCTMYCIGFMLTRLFFYYHFVFNLRFRWYLFSDFSFFFATYSSKILPETANTTKTASRQKTTRLLRTAMESSPIALAMRPGHPTQRKSHLMCMELSTFPSQRCRRIP